MAATVESKEFSIFETGTSTDAVDALAKISLQLPFVAQLYYESLCQVLMHSSTDSLTLKLAQLRQYNARCYYDPIFWTKTRTSGYRFDASVFHPNYQELQELLRGLIEGKVVDVSVKETTETVLQNARSLIHHLGKASQLTAHLAGQQLLSAYPVEITPRLDTELQRFRVANGIRLVVNTSTFKPEIGVVSMNNVSFLVDLSPAKLTITPVDYPN